MTRAPSDTPHPETPSAEGRGAFGGFIGPNNLLALVKSAAPYLFDGSAAAFAKPPVFKGERIGDDAATPLGWWVVLRRAAERGEIVAVETPTPAQLTDYFALCVASHFGSAATYVPTDVDTKIRDHLWFGPRPADEFARLKDFVRATKQWDMRPNSRRYIEVDGEVIAGHDGERLSILCGGMLGLMAAGDVEGASEFEAEVDQELRREARAVEALRKKPGREKDLLLLSAIVTHNVGDVDQGLSAKGGANFGDAQKTAFGKLAHERPERYGGTFALACALYRECMAAEGHRHYPLREARALRRDPELLLPIGPFFDDWGTTVARYKKFTPDERAEVVSAVLEGVRKVKGQEGYQRALAGFHASYPGGLDARDLEPRLSSSARKELKDAELRRKIVVKKESFESSMAKRARVVLAERR